MKVYFDGKCGLCRKEIHYYQDLLKQSNIQWCDIANNPELLPDTISQREALMYFHVADERGKLHKGIEGFLLIWGQIEKPHLFVALRRIIGLPIIKQCASIFYTLFAKIRFNHYAHCKVSR